MLGKQIPPAGLDLSRFILEETPTGVIDGDNLIFNTANIPVTNSFILYLNGLKLLNTEDYTLNSQTITLTLAPIGDDSITCSYSY